MPDLPPVAGAEERRRDDPVKRAFAMIDVGALSKGAVFTEERLIEMFGGDYTPELAIFKTYSIALAKKIKRTLRSMGREWVVRIKRGAIHVPRDATASRYSSKKFAKGQRKMREANAEMRGVDASNLDFDEKQEHERLQIMQGLILVAQQAAARRNARPVPQGTD